MRAVHVSRETIAVTVEAKVSMDAPMELTFIVSPEALRLREGDCLVVRLTADALAQSLRHASGGRLEVVPDTPECRRRR